MRLPIVLLTSFLAMASLPSRAAAAGINLSWDDCGEYGVELKAFSCDTNAGSQTLFGSFVAPPNVTRMSANEVVMDLESGNGTWPAWWGMRTGLCRPASSLAGNWDFTAGPFNCYDYWQAGAIGAFAMDPPTGNRTRIKGVFALPAGDSRITAVPEGLHVYSFKTIINNAKTTGLGVCEGCNVPVCIVLSSIKLDQPVTEPGGSIFLANPATRAHVSWQCPSGPVTDSPDLCLFSSCPTPARSQTWGQIKQLYR